MNRSIKYNLYSLFYNILEFPLEKLLFSKWRKIYIPNLKGKVLEIGVGTGKNLKYYSNNVELTAIDINQGMLNKAIKESKRNYKLLQMDAQDLKFKENTFDYVLCTFVLCSVPNPVKTLKEMKRVLKPKGEIIMLEHVLSKNKLIRLYQDIHNPFTKFLFSCNVNRNTIENIKKANLKIKTEKNLALKDVFKFIICKKNQKY